MRNAPQCKRILKRNENLFKLKINLTEKDDMIIAVISEMNVMTNVRNE